MQRLRLIICSQSPIKIAQVAKLASLGLLLTGFVISLQARGQSALTAPIPALADLMDGVSTRLQLANSGQRFRILHSSIDRRTFSHGSGSERVHLRGPAGHAAELAYPIGRAPVIQEFSAQVDFVSSRAGVRLAARVVLPRSINPTTGQPFELLVRGNEVGAGRNWERLSLGQLPQQLAQHARVARAQHRTALDERGAYVSHLVLLTPGGSGVTELIVDRIEVFGVVDAQPQLTRQQANPSHDAESTKRPRFTGNPQQLRTERRKYVRIPRIIQWQGEPFEFLQQLGFNTIGLDRMPSESELRQADRLGLAIFCPPPGPLELDKNAITDAHNSILAWNLGEQLSADDLSHVENWERLVARFDPVTVRPTVLAPQLNTLAASRITDAILVGRAVVGTNVNLREHSAWLRQRQHLARPGTPTWVKIETQPSSRQQAQIAALGSANVSDVPTSYDQLCAMVSLGLGIKSRGFYFESQSPLDGKQPTTRQRARALELTNLRLQMAEPWLLAGKNISSARSSREELSALVMQAERSHLLVPVWWQQNMHSSVHPRQGGPLSFVVPGVPESSEAFLLTAGGIQRLRHRRVTGGVRISLEQLPLDGLVLLSDDPQAISQITGYVRRIGKRAVQLRQELVDQRLTEAISVAARLGAATLDSNQTSVLTAQAQAEIAASKQQQELAGHAFAYLRADAGDLAVNSLRTQLWQRAANTSLLQQKAVNHVAMPLPDQLQLERTLARAPLSTNLLRGGGFEDLSKLLENGWQHKQLNLDGITTSVRLSPVAPHSGSYCLELEARAIDESAPMTIVPTAPVWIASSPVAVKRGDLLEITGLARLTEPLVGSIDGLQIIDNLGGTDLALKIQEAPTWQPFKLIRAATTDTEVTVTIALSGLGKAQVDDVAVRVVRK